MWATSLTSIHIPASVESIGYNAFYHTYNLTDIYVENGNTNYNDSSHSGVLFKGTTLQFYPSGKTETEYTIPYGTTKIGTHSFFNTLLLKNLIIPDSVTSIGDNAFSNTDTDKSILNIIIYSSLDPIPNLTTNIQLDNIDEKYYWTTPNYSEMEPILVTFKDPAETYITMIDNQTYTIDISGSLVKESYVTQITGTRYIMDTTNSKYFDMRDISSIEIGTKVTSIGDHAFYDSLQYISTTKLISITIPNTVTSIGERAFRDSPA